ncbi:MAG TPA: hypothetical protein VIS76_09385 [Pseudomonadales bacterium]
MNLRKLREAESLFLHRYPGGFDNEELQQIVKKRHNVGRLSEFAAEMLAKPRFKHQAQVLDDIVRIVSRSSMVSMFEKPRFRDFVGGLSRDDRTMLAGAFQRLLHGNQEKGFTDLVDLLAEAGIAKWSLATICLYQFRPEREVFVKPTTTKNVIRQFELEGLTYHPRPTWPFYRDYRDAIEEMKAAVSPALSPSNAAFTGFLMMTTAVGRD